ncbi:MAG: hypothetical protein OEM42_09905, partial [Deltaproteobacteria bacterium]|nr:hypothetical protein [Deltaproteobacteria bacterium]
MKRKKFLVVLVVLAFTASAALAQVGQKPELVLTLSVQKQVDVTGEDGKPKTEWKEVQSTGPGDVLMYTIRYENKGKAEARDAKIIDPVPQNTSYIGESTEGEGAEITFSLDGKTFGLPPMLTYRVKQADGTEVEHVATPDMYTHIQWKLKKAVPPG